MDYPQEDMNLVHQCKKKLDFVNSEMRYIQYSMEYNKENKYYVLNGRNNMKRIVYTGTFKNVYGIFQFIHGMEHVLCG